MSATYTPIDRQLPSMSNVYNPRKESRYVPTPRCAAHLIHLLHPEQLQIKIRTACDLLHEARVEFDAIAFRGSSGLLIGPPVAMRLNKGMILVRKLGELNLHSEFVVEGDNTARSYIVLDDVVATGHTLSCIYDGVKQFAPQAQFKGVLEVSWDRFRHAHEEFGYTLKPGTTDYVKCWEGYKPSDFKPTTNR